MIRLLAALLALTGCGYDDFEAYTPEAAGAVVPNTTIGFIRSVCGDGVYNVTDDMVIGGYVTANDRSGNIYRSFFIEDGTGAAEIRAGMYSLHNVYSRGRYVSVRLQGLAVALADGVLRVGIPPSEGYPGVEYIDNWAVARDYLFPADIFAEPEPLALSLPQLSAAYCGRLVRLEYMRYVETVPEGDGDSGEEDNGDALVPDGAGNAGTVSMGAGSSGSGNFDKGSYTSGSSGAGNKVIYGDFDGMDAISEPWASEGSGAGNFDKGYYTSGSSGAGATDSIPDGAGESGDGEDCGLPGVEGPGDVEEHSSVTWAYPRDGVNTVPAAAYRLFEDMQGNRVAVYTSGYATFAGSYVPVWRVSLTGILSYGATDAGEMFILRLRDETDAVLQVD
ncbi:MAG: DUF5689 domain-containing protein [Rikenellaceae bacterium]|nr:DUF5689 domain-containing protein [Rikenellaceae bacterium]